MADTVSELTIQGFAHDLLEAEEEILRLRRDVTVWRELAIMALRGTWALQIKLREYEHDWDDDDPHWADA